MYPHPDGVGLIPVGTHPDRAHTEVDVLFLHGLTGHAYKTWQNPDSQLQWPEALASAQPGARVWAVHYPAALVSKWAYLAQAQEGTEDIAVRLAQAIAAQAALGLLKAGGPPCIVICHSLGGIVTKRLLLYADRVQSQGLADHVALDPNQLKGILFLGTPHRGSCIATYGAALATALKAGANKVADVLTALDVVVPPLGTALRSATTAGPAMTVLADELKRGNDGLAQLHQDFAALYQRRWQEGLPLHVMAGVELRSPIAYPDALVVDVESADPRLAHELYAQPVPPLKINLDHSQICKPRAQTDEAFQWALSLMERVQPGQGQYGPPSADPAESLLWRVKWAMHVVLVSNVCLRQAWAASRQDGHGLTTAGLSAQVAAHVNGWIGDGSPDQIAASIGALGRLLAALREAGIKTQADKNAILTGVHDLVGLLCVAIGCPAMDANSIIQRAWRTTEPAHQSLLNEVAAAGHKGRAAHLRLDRDTKELVPASSHWTSAELSTDLRLDQMVSNVELTLLHHARAGGRGAMSASLDALRQGLPLKMTPVQRSMLKPIVLDMSARGEGVVIDDAGHDHIVRDQGLLAQFGSSPIAPVLSVLTCEPDAPDIDDDRLGNLAGALTVFRNELLNWNET